MDFIYLYFIFVINLDHFIEDLIHADIMIFFLFISVIKSHNKSL